MELMDYANAHKMLQKYRIKSIESAYVSNPKEAVSFSKGSRIVLKAISQNALHKSKNKLVALDLAPQEIGAAYKQLDKRARQFKPYKILAQKMVKNGLEIIMGCKIDQQFGKMILLGLGGIYVETFRDFALRVCPITKYDAQSMLMQLKSKSIIAPTADSEKLIVDLLLKVSKMFTENSFAELDLNPIMLHDNTYDAVDIRIIK